MANKTFTPGTVIDSPWLNDVNDTVYEILGDGTNAPATKAAARTNLGLGTMATQNANAVAITGGTMAGSFTGNLTGNASGTSSNVTGIVAVANGGTGATAAPAARTNLGFTSAVIDRAFASYSANTTFATIIPIDNTIPQNTEGTQLLSTSLTPKSVTNRVRVRAQVQVASASATNMALAVFSSASANALVATTILCNNGPVQLVVEWEYVPGVTTPLTFTARVGAATGINWAANGSLSFPVFGGTSNATLVVEEIAV